MYLPPFSVDPSGFWSPRQAKAVLEIIAPEGYKRGIRFATIDVTTFGMPAPRVILVPVCIIHDEPIPVNSACIYCLFQWTKLSLPKSLPYVKP